MVSQNAGASEIIDDYRIGMTFPFRDFPERVKPSEMSLARDDQFRQSRRDLVRQMSWEKMAERYLGIFKETLDTSGERLK